MVAYAYVKRGTRQKEKSINNQVRDEDSKGIYYQQYKRGKRRFIISLEYHNFGP